MKRAAHAHLAKLRQPQWVNLYGLLTLLSFYQWIDSIITYRNQSYFWLIVLCGGLYVITFFIFQYGQAVYGINYFSTKARGIWPSRYTAIALGMLALSSFPIVEMNLGTMGAWLGSLTFGLCALLALLAAIADHYQLTKP